MAAQIACMTLSVIAHSCLLYTAWGYALPEPQTQSAIQGRLTVTLAHNTQKKTPLSSPKIAVPRAATAMPLPSETGIAQQKQHLEPIAVIPESVPKQPTPTLAQTQSKYRPQAAPAPTKATPPLQQEIVYKPTPEVAATTSPKPADEVQHAVEAHSATTQPAAILAIESNYTAALLKAIKHHRRYPLRARRRGDEGEVLIDFTILKDGEITHIQIASTSHSTTLDHAASTALEQLGQFKPIPRQLQRNSWDFRIPVRFALN